MRLKSFDKLFQNKTRLRDIKNPQDNVMVKRVQQVMYNMIIVTDIDNNFFNYIDTWSENKSSIACEIKASYHFTVVSTPGQYVYGRNIIFNLAPFVYFWDITDRKKR